MSVGGSSIFKCVCVCVCVCERERESECVGAVDASRYDVHLAQNGTGPATV